MDEVPEGKDWQYEPKWDGFCRIIFAMAKKSIAQRYFPELPSTVTSLKAGQFVLDSEIVVPSGRAFLSMTYCSVFTRGAAV